MLSPWRYARPQAQRIIPFAENSRRSPVSVFTDPMDHPAPSPGSASPRCEGSGKKLVIVGATVTYLPMMQIDGGVGPIGKTERVLLEKVVVPLVVIEGEGEGEEMVGIGSGAIIGPSGIILTAKHVIEDAYNRGVDRVGDDGKLHRIWDLYAMVRVD
jgi:S1-C subfamily serine protease